MQSAIIFHIPYLMGRVTRKEAAPYTMHSLTSQPRTEPYRNHLLPMPELLEKPRFPLVHVPTALQDAIASIPGIFFPFCTWGTCPDKYAFETRNGLLHGNLLMTTATENEDEAQMILLYHLEHSHRLKQKIVAPFEPYGLIYIKQQ